MPLALRLSEWLGLARLRMDAANAAHRTEADRQAFAPASNCAVIDLLEQVLALHFVGSFVSCDEDRLTVGGYG
jgi:hypothetical protein